MRRTLSSCNSVCGAITPVTETAATESGSGAERRVHVLVKPTRPDLATNLVINTDRRTYHLELRATARVHMAAVAWRYPLDEARTAAARAAAIAAAQPPAAASLPPPLNFGYRIEGRARWRPLRVYDDGRQTVIEFPPSVAQGEMPPLFVGAGALVNYRVQGRRMIVDRIFDRAELKLGPPKRPQVVRLRRTGEGGTWPRPQRPLLVQPLGTPCACAPDRQP